MIIPRTKQDVINHFGLKKQNGYKILNKIEKDGFIIMDGFEEKTTNMITNNGIEEKTTNKTQKLQSIFKDIQIFLLPDGDSIGVKIIDNPIQK